MVNINETTKELYKSYDRVFEVVYLRVHQNNTIVGNYGKSNLAISGLTEEVDGEIIDFEINEELDLYVESIPHNTMTIELIDNKGCFDEFSPNYIGNTDRENLNFVLYLQNETRDDIQFIYKDIESISRKEKNIYEITLNSNLSIIENQIVTNKSGSFDNLTSFITFQRYMIAEYPELDFELAMYDEYGNLDYNFIMWTSTTLLLTLKDIFYLSIMYSGRLMYNRHDNSVAWTPRIQSIKETITNDFMLSEPKLTKIETPMVRIKNNFYANNSYFSTTDPDDFLFKYEWSSNIVEPQYVQITGDDYDFNMNDTYKLKNEDIITTNCTAEIVFLTSRVCTILVTPTDITKMCVISIAKTLYKLNLQYNNLLIGNKSNKIIDIDGTKYKVYISNINDYYEHHWNYYHELTLNKPNTKVSVDIIGLPYLELGDCVVIETPKGNKAINITKLSLKYDGGLTESIEGYETDYQGLFPKDDLYPDDDLYPNKLV